MALSAFGALLQGLAAGYQQAKAWQEQERQRKIQELLANLQVQRFQEVEKPESEANIARTNVETEAARHNLSLSQDIVNWWNQQGYGPMGVGVGLKKDLADIAATEAGTRRVLSLLPHEQAIFAAQAANAPRYYAGEAESVWIPVERFNIEKQYLPERLRLSNELLGGQVTAQNLANYLEQKYGEREREAGIQATEAGTEATRGQESRAREEFDWWKEKGYGPGGAQLTLDRALSEIAANNFGVERGRALLPGEIALQNLEIAGRGIANERAQEELDIFKEFGREMARANLAQILGANTAQELENKFNALTFEDRVNAVNLANDLTREQLAAARTENTYRPQLLQLQLDTGLFNLRHAQEMAPYETRTAAAEARTAEAEADVAEATKEYRKRIAEADARLAEGNADEKDLMLAFMPESLALDLQAKALANDISADDLIVREATRDARIQQARLNVQALQEEIKAMAAKAEAGQPIDYMELINFGGKCWDAHYGDPLLQYQATEGGEPIPDRDQFSVEVANRLLKVLGGEMPEEWRGQAPSRPAAAAVEPAEQLASKEAQAAAKWILERPQVNGNPTAARSYWSGMSQTTRKDIADAWHTTPEEIDLALSGRNQKSESFITRIVNWFKGFFK